MALMRAYANGFLGCSGLPYCAQANARWPLVPDDSGFRAVLLDLDNTLLFEDESTERALQRTCAPIAGRTGANGAVLVAAAREAADDLFGASSVFAYANAMGIWWGEALWGDFLGEAAGLRDLRAFVPGFRRDVWSRALAAVGI